MEVQIKKTIRAGNSSAVVLPRAWLDKEVRVELVKKSAGTILREVLNIIGKNIPLGEIIGIYLVGSYARGEEDEKSDIDILVVTKDSDKNFSEGIYNILAVSEELLKQKLRNDLFPLGGMIKESKALINENYLDSLKVRVTKKNVKWYIKTTKEKIKLIEKILDKLEKRKIKYADNRITYTLVLRIRTLEIIKKLLKDEIYSKKEFIKLIKNISGSDKPYEKYTEVKDNLNCKSESTVKENRKLLEYLKKSLKDVEKSFKIVTI